MLVSCGSLPQPALVLQLLLHTTFVASTQVFSEWDLVSLLSRQAPAAESSSAAEAYPAWEREGQGEDGEQVVPPELAVGPRRLLLQTGSTGMLPVGCLVSHLPSHQSTFVSQVPPLSSGHALFGDALFSLQNTTILAASSQCSEVSFRQVWGGW